MQSAVLLAVHGLGPKSTEVSSWFTDRHVAARVCGVQFCLLHTGWIQNRARSPPAADRRVAASLAQLLATAAGQDSQLKRASLVLLFCFLFASGSLHTALKLT